MVAEGAGQELYPPRAGSDMEGLKRTREALPLVTRAGLLCDCDLFNGCLPAAAGCPQFAAHAKASRCTTCNDCKAGHTLQSKMAF